MAEIMKIITLADIHGSTKAVENIADRLECADIVLIAGDITNFGDVSRCAAVIDTIRRYNPTVFAVPGNCDPPGIDKYLEQEGINLHMTCLEHQGMAFTGLAGALPGRGRVPGETGEEMFAAYLEQVERIIPKDMPLVLLTHQPPRSEVVDSPAAGIHLGSVSIREFILRTAPVLAVSGHIHEAAGVEQMGPTTLINPGPCKGGNFGIIEIEAGRVSASVKKAG